jgi:enamine deaminase RidA (YjgF/YER057c/UK114 family)
MSAHRVLLPAGWPRPSGYSNGVLAAGPAIFLGGQIGWDNERRFAQGMAGQVEQALRNIVTILAEGGAGPEDIVRLTWFVTDMAAYRADPRGIGDGYRRVMGRHFPVMSVVGVTALVEPDALVEIEATAVPRAGA